MLSPAAVLVCALSMLGRSEHRFHPINFVEIAPIGVSRNAEAFVTRNPPTIHLITSSEVFREATSSRFRCGPRAAIAKIASILMHEEWHLRNGADERSAYAEQLTTLRALGFAMDSLLYGVVTRSMLAQLKSDQLSTYNGRGSMNGTTAELFRRNDREIELHGQSSTVTGEWP